MKEKLAEKINSLKSVIGAGGNYLLNIGPTGDGAVTNYEKDLLLSIGKWIDSSGWLATARDSLYRDNGIIKAKAVKNRNARRSDAVAVLVDEKGNRIYKLKDADTLYHYSMFDYYRTKKAVCSYRWNFPYSTNNSKIRIIVPDIESDFEAVYKNGNVVKLTHKREIEPANYDKLLLPKNIDSKHAIQLFSDLSLFSIIFSFSFSSSFLIFLYESSFSEDKHIPICFFHYTDSDTPSEIFPHRFLQVHSNRHWDLKIPL